MTDFNHEFLEIADIIPAFTPVDLQTGANNGQWVAMKNIGRLLCVLYKGTGTAGDDPVITLKQATSTAGANAKALNFTRARTKIGAIAATPQWTVVTQSASNTYTPTDLNNGFNFVQISIPDTGTNPQLGAAFYIAYGIRYPQLIAPSNLT